MLAEVDYERVRSVEAVVSCGDQSVNITVDVSDVLTPPFMLRKDQSASKLTRTYTMSYNLTISSQDVTSLAVSVASLSLCLYGGEDSHDQSLSAAQGPVERSVISHSPALCSRSNLPMSIIYVRVCEHK